MKKERLMNFSSARLNREIRSFLFLPILSKQYFSNIPPDDNGNSIQCESRPTCRKLTEFRSCVESRPGLPVLMSLTVSVDVKQH